MSSASALPISPETNETNETEIETFRPPATSGVMRRYESLDAAMLFDDASVLPPSVTEPDLEWRSERVETEALALPSALHLSERPVTERPVTERPSIATAFVPPVASRAAITLAEMGGVLLGFFVLTTGVSLASLVVAFVLFR